MFNSITLTKEQKYIVIIGAVLLFIGVIIRFYPESTDTAFTPDEIEIKKEHIEKYSKIVAKKAQIEKKRAIAKRMLNRTEARLLTGNTPPLAAVEIQNILKEITALSNVEIKTMRVMGEKISEDTDYVRIPVRFSIQCNILQLKEILYGIESSQKLLMVTALKVDSASAGQQGRLQSTIITEGVMRFTPNEG